ncbi:6-phospho-3-hexuloisomerase [Chloroflexota bacterium]
MQTHDLINAILDDLSRTLHQVDANQIDALQAAIINAQHIYVAGKGRTGLLMKAFAMRLMHLGLTVHVVDDVTTPGIKAGDLLIIGSGSGRTASLVSYAEKVQTTGASLATITGNQGSPIAALAQHVVIIPASNFKSGNQPTTESVLLMGSLFEHTLGLLCDLITIQLKATLNQSEGEMNARHANLE